MTWGLTKVQPFFTLQGIVGPVLFLLLLSLCIGPLALAHSAAEFAHSVAQGNFVEVFFPGNNVSGESWRPAVGVALLLLPLALLLVFRSLGNKAYVCACVRWEEKKNGLVHHRS